MGQGAALQTGISLALRDPRVQHVVTFDADGQHHPRDAARMVTTAVNENYDAVLGSRFLVRGNDIPASRRLVLRLAVLFTRFTTGLAVTDAHNGLRVFSRNAAAQLRIRQPGMAHASEILSEVARLDFSYTELPVSISYTDYSQAKGQSNLNAINILHDLFTARIRNS
jgi:glycosyltransferase involved in cell wall biosynthesis